jgi:DUF4097 and DUF4098 domain-containing protein YvlB
MTTYDFETAGPVELAIELAKGHVAIQTTESNHAHVEISGREADRVKVEQRGDRLVIADPQARRPFGFTHPGFDVQVVVPASSALAVKTASADVDVTGTVGATAVNTAAAAVRIERVEGSADINSGSGSVAIASAQQTVRIKSASGDVTVGTAAGAVIASTGSGDVAVGRAQGPVSVKTGSGDLRVATAEDDISLLTASGDLEVGAAHRGRVVHKGASGDIRVGVPAGTPVWTDITTFSGQIRSGLSSVGQPEDGQDHLELRARTYSGDVTLVEV